MTDQRRRRFLQLAAAGAVGGAVTWALGRKGESVVTSSKRAPALFISHGSPMVAVEDDAYTEALARYGGGLRPDAIVVVSAHWEATGPIRVTSSERPATIHDFGGFPPALYQLAYGSPGAPALAAEVAELLSAAGHEAALDPARGLDHGVWVPLRRMFPAADVPVIAVSLPRPRDEAELVRIGEALAPLRDRNILLVGSGGVVHNLRRIDWNKGAAVMDWSRGFDQWVAESLELDRHRLLAWREAPFAQHAVPTTEHFDPLFVILGASRAEERLDTIFAGFHHGSLSMRSFGFRAA